MTEDLLFLPGLLCDDALFAAQIAELPCARVADLTQDDHVDRMASRALAAMPGRFALCGLSMGGYVALAIMRAAPERVTRLCLMDTQARADSASQTRSRQIIMGLARNHRFRGVTPRLLPMLLHPDSLADPQIIGAVTEMAERVGRDAFLRQQQAIIDRPDSLPSLAAIAVPTLVAVGSHDTVTPPPLSEEMAALIPGARLAVIEGAGHLPPLEQARAVTEIIRAWLA
jgi:pimeloyl-ACP methyl ester carboxylesterase